MIPLKFVGNQQKGDSMNRRKQVLPPTSQRVYLRTDPLINAEIRNKTLRNLKMLRGCSKEDMTERIRELNLEWDTERVLEANAALLILLSSALGLRTNKGWFLLSGIIGAFMLQHALQGWCPPVPLLRRWGVRTEDEINAEKLY